MTTPNIIFILADDMGYGDLGCYGATQIPTPHMDQVAAQGMRFTDAHSSSAVCTPSRYSVLTGRYCWRTRLQRWVLGGFGTPLIEPDRLTVAAMLKEQGYATTAIGKWHLGFDWTRQDGGPASAVDFGTDAWSVDGFDIDYSQPLRGGPVDVGFDSFFGIAGSLDMAPYCFIENDRVVGTPDREKEIYYNQQRRGMQTPGWADDQVDIQFAAKAVDFVHQHTAEHPDQPFFLYLAPASPHRPCDIRPDFVKGTSTAGDRGDMVVLFDWVVGQVTAALDALGIAENTVLIVTSDNGARALCANGQDYGHRVSGPLRGQKADIWDGGHREPFLVRWPGHVPAGVVSHELVSLTDFMATCGALVGVDLPPTAAEDSYNLLPILLGRNGSEPARQALVHHSGEGLFALRSGQWKLIRGLGSGGFSEPRQIEVEPNGPTGQLYDMAAGVGETHNLWLERPQVVAELSALLDDWIVGGRSAPTPSV